MAGIAFPVMIHLWNNKQGKVLPIGSMAFLDKGSRKQARSRKLSEWWLLLLRCLLLLLLALLLSGPFWRLSPAGSVKKGWVLIGKEDATVHAYQPMIDSLLKAGYERHIWGDGSISRDTGTGRDHGRLSYWDFFRAADRDAPAGIPFYAFTSSRRSGFRGQRPVTDRMVSWYTYTPVADTLSHYITEAWLSSPDSIVVLPGSSRPTGSSYCYQVLPAKAGATEAMRKDSLTDQGHYRVGSTDGHLSVALDSQPPVIVDTAVLRIQICTDDKYTNDGHYLVGAIQALREFTRRNIRTGIGSISNRMIHSDWVFWLSSQPVPAGLAAANIVCYEAGGEIPVDSWVRGIPGVGVEKLTGMGNVNYPIIWKDGFGRPLLTLETKSGRRIFHFFSHFDPAWNGLVWSPRFPVLLQELLFASHSFSGGNLAGEDLSKQDRRVLDPAQILPQKGSAPSGEGHLWGSVNKLTSDQSDLPVDERPAHNIDLAPFCWILIFLLFLTERMVSFRSPKLKTYG